MKTNHLRVAFSVELPNNSVNFSFFELAETPELLTSKDVSMLSNKAIEFLEIKYGKNNFKSESIIIFSWSHYTYDK